ncbi:hypothetical protein HU200_050717 [Digitaria exilis]|uniref:Uncharacterized protein n=1 Tax=Digitaria exilis TaxID=1010633 RepID=A0A835ARW1_9POAL|nr:hypothetical protein HU200_050717 [Digitaria exilis]
MSNRSSISLDAYFNEQLDSVAGRVLPVIVKEKICKVLHSFCFGSGLSVNLDIHSINFLPDEFKSTFALIMNHLYSVDSQAEKLVLDVIKLISQFAPTPHIPVSPLPQSRPATHRATGSQEFNALPSSEDLSAKNNFDLSQMRDVHDAESKETDADDAEASLSLPVPKLNLSASKSPLNMFPPNHQVTAPLQDSRLHCLSSFGKENSSPTLSENIENYKVICKLASSQFQGLYQKPNGHPDVSKRHYLFPNIAENLLKDPDEIDQAILARAFQRSSKARPVHQSNMVDNIFPPFAFNVISISFPFKL